MDLETIAIIGLAAWAIYVVREIAGHLVDRMKSERGRHGG